MRPLAGLRLRLTVWYAATFCVILAMLGGGLYLTMRSQVRRDLDLSLREAVAELERAALTEEIERAAAGQVSDAIDELRIPDRTLYLLDAAGVPLNPPQAPDWIRAAAAAAARAGEIALDRETTRDRTLRVYAKRLTLRSGERRVALAVADEIELEDTYAALFAAFVAASLAAVLLVAIGGWFLVRQSTQPVERSMTQMRRFMADAAHELRTPLTIVRTRADVALQQDRSSAEYGNALRGIATDVERLSHIVDDLLTLASADAGERSIDRRAAYLDDVALDAAEGARVVALARGVSLEIDGFEEAAVEGDPALLRQLVMILLDNAIKFTPSGGSVRVTVGAVGGRARLIVDDTGIGIPADQLPHIFERFYRGDPARARQPALPGAANGAGLGLSIALWIAEAHGASIEFVSTPGQGSRATVTFPVMLVASSG